MSKSDLVFHHDGDFFPILLHGERVGWIKHTPAGWQATITVNGVTHQGEAVSDDDGKYPYYARDKALQSLRRKWRELHTSKPVVAKPDYSGLMQRMVEHDQWKREWEERWRRRYERKEQGS